MIPYGNVKIGDRLVGYTLESFILPSDYLLEQSKLSQATITVPTGFLSLLYNEVPMVRFAYENGFKLFGFYKNQIMEE